ncbi:unnamed protein product [Schistosoma margrebowiei]|uniref:Uncharacterized protein n=1 Tax=Schistosoma margrebowiei TaxID=48269 RepID=A0A183MZ82_9TREM|nr:unnamed protein product [Schistosoma margrebowiei]
MVVGGSQQETLDPSFMHMSSICRSCVNLLYTYCPNCINLPDLINHNTPIHLVRNPKVSI